MPAIIHKEGPGSVRGLEKGPRDWLGLIKLKTSVVVNEFAGLTNDHSSNKSNDQNDQF